MQEIFGPDGLIARAHPDYEHRLGQIDMERAVMRAFEDRKRVIVEAGDGHSMNSIATTPDCARSTAEIVQLPKEQ